MTNTNENKMTELIDQAVAYLKEVPEGTEYTSYLLLKELGFDPRAKGNEDFDLMRFHFNLFTAVENSEILLDTSEYADTVTGLPFNIPFVVYHQEKVQCPKCGSKSVAQLLYGMPAFSDQLKKAIDEGRIALGGCCITGDDPQYRCNDCGHKFDI